eukprot:COSAG02_NODE_563_length_20290_cov_23.664108_12_plen_77_part_00
MLVNIVLLNLLIALMGGSYEKVAEKSTRETLKHRAELIVGYEQTMSNAELANEQWHPTFIHALIPANDDEDGESRR